MGQKHKNIKQKLRIKFGDVYLRSHDWCYRIASDTVGYTYLKTKSLKLRSFLREQYDGSLQI
jgi:hypothetical protein